MTSPLVEHLTASPFWTVLGMRTGSSTAAGRALVLVRPDGSALLELPGGAAAAGFVHPRPKLTQLRRDGFRSVCWVSLGERTCWVHLPGRTYGETAHPGSSHPVAWRAADVVALAQRMPDEEDIPRLIAADLHARAAGGGDQPRPVAQGQYRMDWLGIHYRVLPRPPAPPAPPAPPGTAETAGTQPGTASGPPAAWGHEDRSSFHFYRRLVAEDPGGLAALWLMRHPNQAKEVLDWSVAHRTLLAGPQEPEDPGSREDREDWEHLLAAQLRDLSAQDRSFVGANVALMLKDLGIEGAEETLRGVQDPPDGTVPGPAGGTAR